MKIRFSCIVFDQNSNFVDKICEVFEFNFKKEMLNCFQIKKMIKQKVKIWSKKLKFPVFYEKYLSYEIIEEEDDFIIE